MYGCGGLPRVFPHLSQVSPLPRCNFHSLKACLEACLEAWLEACLILAKCLFCSTFPSINDNFHSLEACLEACLILAKHVSPLLQFP